jgi:flagellar biosynthesis protein FlhB
MAEDTGGEKSLPASPQKIQKSRLDGNIAKSQDLSGGIALGMGLVAIMLFGPMSLQNILAAGRYYIGNAHELTANGIELVPLTISVLRYLAYCTLPLALFMLAVGLATNLAQIGFLLTGKPLVPKLSRLNPISGFQRYVSMRSLVEFIKSLAKLILVVVVVWFALRNRVGEFVILMAMTPLGILSGISWLVFSVWWRIAVVMVFLGMADYAYQRWQHRQDLRMTHQEAKMETREMEGDPQIKRRVRQLQRQMATQKMMQDVPDADVIITNPVRFAVALRYDMDNMKAPIVVAKGARKIAEKIRDLGTEHDVPIVQKPELARALYRSLEVGQGIPEHLFRAVAEVLSFVYSIDRRQEKIRERQHASAATGS